MIPERRRARLVLLAVLIAALTISVVPVVGAWSATSDPTPGVDVVKLQGVIDPAEAAYVKGTIQDAEAAGGTVVLQIDSRGSFGDGAVRLAAFIRRASVPVIAWVGPSAAVAAGGSVLVMHASSLAAIAPGAGLGPARPFDLGTSESRESSSDVQRTIAALFGPSARRGSLTEDQRRLLDGPAFPAGPARQAGFASVVAGDIPSLLDTLDGMTAQTPRGTVTLATQSRPERPVAVRFHEIGPIWRVLHAVSTPIAVYVLVLVGLWAIAFELTQPALGVAGIAGVVALVFAGYGLSVIPVHWLGIALVLAGTALQGLDVLIRRVAWLTLLGTTLFAAGSLLAWRGVAPAIDLPLWLIALATVGGVLFLGFAMTVALRSRERVKTAQVGLVGLVGETRSDLNPEGGVLVKGAMWRARSMDGPIPKGARVRIRGVEGLILRVEQEPGQD